MRKFFCSERGGSEIATLLPTLVLAFFVFFAGAVLLHLASVRAAAHMAAREGARTYGITHSSDQAASRVWQYLREANLVPQDAPPPSPQGSGRYVTSCPRVTAISFRDDGTWATCSITYNFLNPNPFRNLPRLVLDPSPWKPNGFSFTVEGAAKHEYQP